MALDGGPTMGQESLACGVRLSHWNHSPHRSEPAAGCHSGEERTYMFLLRRNVRPPAAYPIVKEKARWRSSTCP